MTVEELTYKVPFQMYCSRDDYVHALVMHFDTTFARCHTKPVLPTGPSNVYTHWKQTVFYLSEVLTVKAGEVIRGTISCAPNAKNHRDQDFELEIEVGPPAPFRDGGSPLRSVPDLNGQHSPPSRPPAPHPPHSCRRSLRESCRRRRSRRST